MNKTNTTNLRTKYNMAFLCKSLSCLLILFIPLIFIAMANVSSDVNYLRQQYQTGKKQKDQLVIQYDNKSFQDGDELKKSDTQTKPNVQINVQTDAQHPYLTLVKYSLGFFDCLTCL